MPATHGLAATVMANAGREAAGLARRLRVRFIDRSLTRSLPAVALHMTHKGRGSTADEFAARVSAGKQIEIGLRPFRSQITRLLDDAARGAARKVSQNRRVPRTIPAAVFQPALTAALPVRSRALTSARFRQPKPFRPLLRQPSLPMRLTSPQPFVPGLTVPQKMAAPNSLEILSPSPSQNVPLRPQKTEPFEPASALTPSRLPQDLPTRRAPEISDDDAIDYRLLRPTALRDTLRRRGGPGTGLEFAVRERLRGPLKFDPGLARLHRSPAAAEAARALRAEAFTIGQDVFFGEGRYNLSSKMGLGLLAHELTHVGQQMRQTGVEMRFFTPQGGDAQEKEAQQTAGSILAQESSLGASFDALYDSGTRAQPQMSYAMPPAKQSAVGTAVSPVAALPPGMAPGHRTAAGGADARELSDRVYQLMVKELTRDRQRGLERKRG